MSSLREDDQMSNSDGEDNTALLNDDCGIKALPCLAKRYNIQKFAKIPIFVFLLAVIGALQGSLFAYFKGTSPVWKKYQDFSDDTADWIIYSSDVFSGLFALLIAYWGNRINRASWIGCLAMVYAFSAYLLIIPEMVQPDEKTQNVTAVSLRDQLCIPGENGTNHDIQDEGSRNIGIILFLNFQLFHALSVVSFLAHGITYVDDHLLDLTNSAMTIGIILVMNIIGRSVGIYLSWIPVTFNRYIFFSFSWIVIVTLILFFGFLISMFPKILFPNVKAKSMDSLDRIDINLGFFATLKRLFTNRLLLLSILAATTMSIAQVNFGLLRNDFFRSRFIDMSAGGEYSEYQEPQQAVVNPKQIIQPISGSLIMMSGVIITRFNPRARYLAGWNIFIYVMSAALFASYAFVNCEDTTFWDDAECLSNCKCNKEIFAPVCVITPIKNITYYSPCYAGCEYKADKFYFDCGCEGYRAKKGSCNSEKCNNIIMFAQSTGVITNGLLASGFVAHLLITLRCVLDVDKPTALGLHVTISKVTPYLPFKFLYDLLKYVLCSKYVNDTCVQYNAAFPSLLSVITCVLMLAAAVFMFFLAKFAKDLNLYKLKTIDSCSRDVLSSTGAKESYDDIQFEEISPRTNNQLSSNIDNNSVAYSESDIRAVLSKMDNDEF